MRSFRDNKKTSDLCDSVCDMCLHVHGATWLSSEPPLALGTSQPILSPPLHLDRALCQKRLQAQLFQLWNFWKRQWYEDSKRVTGCQGLGLGGGMSRTSTENFYGSGTAPCDNIPINTCHYTFLQSHTTHDIKSESLCELWTLGGFDVHARPL